MASGAAAVAAVERWAAPTGSPPLPEDAAEEHRAAVVRADRFRGDSADSVVAVDLSAIRRTVIPDLLSSAQQVCAGLSGAETTLEGAREKLRYEVDVRQRLIRRRELLVELRSQLVDLHRPVAAALQLSRPGGHDADFRAEAQLDDARRIIDEALNLLSRADTPYLASVETALSQRRATLATHRQSVMRRKVHCDPVRGVLVIERLQENASREQLASLVNYITTDEATQALPIAIRRATWVKVAEDPADHSGLFLWGFQAEPGHGVASVPQSKKPEERIFERLVMLFDLLLETWRHPKAPDLVAGAFERWLVETVVDSHWVLGLPEPPRPFLSGPHDVVWSAVAGQIKAISAASRIADEAIGAKAPANWPSLEGGRLSFDSIQVIVGRVSRAEILMHTRSVSSEFPKDDEQHIVLAPGGSPHISPEKRDPGWFPSCFVTRSSYQVAALIREVFIPAICTLYRDGAGLLADHMIRATREALESYRTDVPIQFAGEIGSNLRLQALFHNDCLLLGHVSSLINEERVPPSFVQPIVELDYSFQSTATQIRATLLTSCRVRIKSALDPISKNDALAQAASLFGRRKVHQCLARALASLRELVSMIAGILPIGDAQQVGNRLVACFLDMHTQLIIELESISVSACEAISTLMETTLRSGKEVVLLTRNNVLVAEESSRVLLAKAERRLESVRGILDSRMDEVLHKFLSNDYAGLLTAEEIHNLILAIFEDTPHRSQYLSQLRLRPESTAATNYPQQDNTAVQHQADIASQPEGLKPAVIIEGTSNEWNDWKESSSEPEVVRDAEDWGDWKEFDSDDRQSSLKDTESKADAEEWADW